MPVQEVFYGSPLLTYTHRPTRVKVPPSFLLVNNHCIRYGKKNNTLRPSRISPCHFTPLLLPFFRFFCRHLVNECLTCAVSTVLQQSLKGTKLGDAVHPLSVHYPYEKYYINAKPVKKKYYLVRAALMMNVQNKLWS